MTPIPTASRPWRKILAAYHGPSLPRSIVELLLTAVPLVLIWTAAGFALAHDLWWLALALSLPASVFLVRLFMVQHDCGHRSFFKSAAANDWVGRVIGVFTLTPYDCWRRTHAIHHATSGDLDRRGLGAVNTLTVEEYLALSPLKRFGYRLYRHPMVLFGLAPAYMFLLDQRLPMGLMREGWRPWVSAMSANVAIAAIVLALLYVGGWQAVVLVYLPTIVGAASIGMWLFYVQHQFQDTYWTRREDWDLTEAALLGSSYYDLPPVLRWLTANIGIHHVHHVSSHIPFYRLQTVLQDHPELRDVSRMTFLQSLRCIGLSLWDEAGQRLLTFKQSRARRPA